MAEAGALEMMKRLLAQRHAAENSAYADADRAEADAIGALSRPRSNQGRAGLALAAGLLSPTRSGSSAEGWGKAASGYSDALDKNDDYEMDTATKIAAIRRAQAGLKMRAAGSGFSNGMEQFKLPGQALQYQDDLDDLNDDGSDLTPMPGAARRTEATPPPAAPAGGAPPPAAPAAPGGGAPNGNVGSLAPVAQYAQAQEAGLPGDMPGDDAVNFPQTGAQTASLDATGPIPSGLGTPAPEPGPPPQQVAQAGPAPGAQPAPAPAPPSMERQQYDWAMQIRNAAASNPAKWARRPKYQKTLELANKVIDDFRLGQASQSNIATQQARMAQLAAETELKVERAADPMKKERMQLELKRLAEVEKGARGALETQQAIAKTRKAREGLWMGEDDSTGGIGGWLTEKADGWVDTGKKGVAEATGALRAMVIEAQNVGAITQTEFAAFSEQVPGVSMGKKTADEVLKGNEAIAQRQIEQAKFFRRYQAQFGSIAGADEQWQAFTQAKPIIDRDKDNNLRVMPERAGQWQDYLQQPSYLSGRADAAPGANVPRISNVEEYNALKKGQPYIDPNGKPKVKQ